MFFSGKLKIIRKITTSNKTVIVKAVVVEGEYEHKHKVARKSISFFSSDKISQIPQNLYSMNEGFEFEVNKLPLFYHTYWKNKEKTVRGQFVRAKSA